MSSLGKIYGSGAEAGGRPGRSLSCYTLGEPGVPVVGELPKRIRGFRHSGTGGNEEQGAGRPSAAQARDQLIQQGHWKRAAIFQDGTLS